MSSLTIVMYHYVRELKHSRYPAIKGLAIDHFKEQIAYQKKYYNPISAYDLMDAIESGSKLPPKPLLLTFDDAYIDHFTEVFPVLDKEKLSGCFFPPAKCIIENRVLDVNKIHFILACVPDKSVLVNYIYQSLDENRSSYHLESKEFYWQKCGVPSRYDTAEVMFVKYMLQLELPVKLRYVITDELFKKFVSNDEKAFSKELYMSIDQISCLQRNGMYIGSHGFDHYWLNSISEDAQRKEIDLSLDFLKKIGSDLCRWIMCYPYGAYNESLLTILKEKNCVITDLIPVQLQRDKREPLPPFYLLP
ncbi:MAG: polysaccharide deacetylase family protein [Candidatus Methanoperedens sp.]